MNKLLALGYALALTSIACGSSDNTTQDSSSAPNGTPAQTPADFKCSCNGNNAECLDWYGTQGQTACSEQDPSGCVGGIGTSPCATDSRVGYCNYWKWQYIRSYGNYDGAKSMCSAIGGIWTDG